MSFPEVMALLGCIVILVLGMCLVVWLVVWLVYCISSVARAADALERIADALEDKDAE